MNAAFAALAASELFPAKLTPRLQARHCVSPGLHIPRADAYIATGAWNRRQTDAGVRG